MNLTDTEKSEVTRFVENRNMREAIRKVFEYIASENKLSKGVNPVALASFSDERIGEIVRAQIEATSIINRGFQELSRYAVVEVRKPKIITGH